MIGKEVLRIRGLSKIFKPFRRPEIKAVNGKVQMAFILES